ncbi:MAG: hypothetical protein LBE76_08605 [Nitrososphaerota archaeon]|jgi:aspartokinase-like uncharacterized kinase|nr:hypothetical protein [Nitrososphaerota archaeon]
MTLNVIKIGGSLTQKPEALKILCQKLDQLASKHQIIVIPGGGKFADCVRETDKHFSLTNTTTHHMAILGMNQYGLLLANLIPNSQTTDNIKEAKNTKEKIVIFLPSKFMNSNKKLPETWEITSDTIAAYIAKKLQANKLVLIKDVDGIFTNNPKKNTQSKLIEHLTTNNLLETKNKTCIDTYIPKILKTAKINCHIINGFYPDRIEAILNNQKTINTTISP